MDPIEFHEATKHSPVSVRQSRHFLDWANKPHPFKDYGDLESIRLPPFSDTGGLTADAIAEQVAAEERELDLAEVARLLVLGTGVLREKVYPDGERFYFRTYASAGALYPVEVYLACARVAGLDPGLYHFHPLERSLRRLREGDPRPDLLRACGERSAAGSAAVAVIVSAIPWRTTWKYQARGYRHLFWDGGMIIANLLALAASGGHHSEVVLWFADAELDRFLGVDGEDEMALAVVPIGTAGSAPPPPAESAPSRLDGSPPVLPAESVPPPLDPSSRGLPRNRRRYREISAVHAATSLDSPPREAPPERAGRARGELPAADLEAAPLERVIRRRGSTRAFRGDPVPAGQLLGILARAFWSLSADWGPPLVHAGVLVHACDGLESGSYRFAGGELELLATGDFRDAGYFLCLEQPLGGDGAATCFLLADLQDAVQRLGPRAYRAAQLEAGIVAGRIYLGAYACRFGATGLTFYDDQVRSFFGTMAEPMLAVALGHPARRRRLL